MDGKSGGEVSIVVGATGVVSMAKTGCCGRSQINTVVILSMTAVAMDN